MTARLPFERKRKGRIAIDVDPIYGVHLDRNGKRHDF
jgi:hypothetical protein